MQKILIIFLSFICLFPVTANASEFSDKEKTELTEMMKQFLSENGALILESVSNYQNELQAKQQEEAAEQAAAFMKTLDKMNLPSAGNPKGDVTIVEFFDYNCGYCRKALEAIQEVIEKDKDVRVVFMEMPILGPQSFEAAKWALAAHQQGKYFDYHQKVMDHNGPKDEKNLERLAKQAGLDVSQLKKDKESDAITEILNKNTETARSMGIQGTPGFIIGTQVSPGYMQADRILAQIKAIRDNK